MLHMVLDKTVVDRMFDISIEEDSAAFVRDARTPTVTDISKGEDVSFKFLVDHVERADVMIHFVRSDDMVSDILTMSLKRVKLKSMVKLSGMC